MYVYLCNGISDKKVRQAIRRFSPHSLQQLEKFIPVGNQYDECVRTTCEVMEGKSMQLSGSKGSTQAECAFWPTHKPFYASKSESEGVKK